VVVTTLVLVEVVAGVAAAEDDEAAGDVAATDGVEAAGDAAAVVEVLALAADVVEPGDVGVLPLADAIPQTAPRNPPIDKRAAAARVRRAGWRRRMALRSCGSGAAGIVGSLPSFGCSSWPQRWGRRLTGL
jgi:hypothetical protein